VVEKARREPDLSRRGDRDRRCSAVAEAVWRNAMSESCFGVLRNQPRNRVSRQRAALQAEPKGVMLVRVGVLVICAQKVTLSK
jgi:hypothetical protein